MPEALDHVMGASGLSFQYLYLYSDTLCNGSLACLQHLVVPPVSEQLNVITNYGIAEHAVQDMRGLESVMFRLLLNHQNDVASALVDAIKELESIDRSIQDIISFSLGLHEATDAMVTFDM